MKINRLLMGCLVTSIGALTVSVFAQVARPYHNGSVWEIAMIRVKPGMDQAYFDYLTTQ